MTWTRPARLLLLPPLVGAALAGPVALPALADDAGHDHSTMDHSTMDHATTDTSTTDPHDHDTMQHRTLDMDYSTGATHDHGTQASTGHDHGTDASTEHQHGTAPPKDRPLGLLLGTFGGVNGAVVIGAALVRRRERSARQQKQARRSEGRAIPAEVAE
jgi:hypothetical protein